MSPISTAKFNPQSSTFCLSPTSKFVWIPVLLNNTEVASLKYTHTHLVPNPDGSPKVDRIDVSARELKSITQAYQNNLQATRQAVAAPSKDDEEYDEYDDDDDDEEKTDPHSNLQKTQTMVYLRISKPGIIKLEQVLDHTNTEARISASEVVVVPCPKVTFLDESKAAPGSDIQCAGQDTNRELMISVFGVPPLSLRWWKSVNGVREPTLVEGIESEDSPQTTPSGSLKSLEPKQLSIPLNLVFKEPGTYVYGLEEIIDGVGNVVRAEGPSDVTPTRSFVILTRPSVSFTHCSQERPTSLLIGSEAAVGIRVNDADLLDGPLEISLSYVPFSDEANSKYKPYNKVLRTREDRNSLSFMAGSPGEYVIDSVKGKVRLPLAPPG